MGWLFSYDTHKTINDLVAELSDPKRFSEGWTLVMSRRVGNHHWYLVRDARGHDHIGLDLMKGRNLKLNEGPCHKGMGKATGPTTGTARLPSSTTPEPPRADTPMPGAKPCAPGTPSTLHTAPASAKARG